MDIESYLDLVERYWGAISVYDGNYVFQTGLELAPLPARHLGAAHWCQSEVRSGGFLQFFANSTGVLAPEAVTGFAAIEMPQAAACLQQAMAFFGEPYPRDQGTRNDALDARRLAHPDSSDPFVELNRAFCGCLDAEAGGWNVAADIYAQLHAG